MKIKASKRFKKLIEISKNKQIETIEEAIKKVKKNCTSKFGSLPNFSKIRAALTHDYWM